MLVGVTGYGVAMLFLLHGAPDLALTQMLVETVTLVIFALVLRKLPKYFTTGPLHSSRWWRLVIAIAVGRSSSAWRDRGPARGSPSPVSEGFYEAAYTSATARTSSTSPWSTSGRGTPWVRSRSWSSRPPASPV